MKISSVATSQSSSSSNVDTQIKQLQAQAASLEQKESKATGDEKKSFATQIQQVDQQIAQLQAQETKSSSSSKSQASSSEVATPAASLESKTTGVGKNVDIKA